MLTFFRDNLPYPEVPIKLHFQSRREGDESPSQD
jgi:hypothetical protein